MKFEYKGNSKKSGVYQIRNLVDEKVYVGSAKRFKERGRQHYSSLRKGQHHNKHLQAAFDRDGEDAFVFEVLEVVEGNRSIYSKVEQQYINQYLDNWEQCYNFDKKSVSSPRRVFSRTPEETRAKKSASLKESWKDNDERREQVSSEAKQRWEDPQHRKHISDCTKQQWASGALSRNMTEEVKTKISETKGALITIEGVSKAATQWAAHPDCSVNAKCIRKRLRRGWEPEKAVFTPSLAGVVTEEHKARISAKNKGRKHTIEARQKMSESKKGCTPWNKKAA